MIYIWKKGYRGYVGLCPLMLKYTVHMYVAKKRGQGSGVCISRSSFRDGVPGITIAWSQRQGVYSQKKKPAAVLCFCDDISFLPFLFFLYIHDECLLHYPRLKEKKKKPESSPYSNVSMGPDYIYIWRLHKRRKKET